MMRERDRYERILAKLGRKQDPESHYFRFVRMTMDENESDPYRAGPNDVGLL